MLQTLFHIPHELAGWPVFGVGWALGAWIVLGVVWLLLLSRIPEKRKELAGALPLMLLVAAMIVFIAPRLEEADAAGKVLGVPIRGYGVMMLVAIVTGVGLASYRARRMGLDPELMFSLALWMCIAGVIGARAFYVVQKWEQFYSSDPVAMATKIFSFTEGGLVVFGSAIGALAALILFCRLKNLPTLAIADLVAPSMMFGLAIGRIGCLLNGCCYGGYCELPLALKFPPEAPVYADQLTSGELFGARMAERVDPTTKAIQVVAVDVRPGSPAADVGIETGEVITYIAGYKIDGMQDVRFVFGELAKHVEQNRAQGKPTEMQVNRHSPWVIDALPPRSLPVHPTQIYSAIDALVLGLVLWFFYPFRRHDGEVIALMLTLHPISRFLLEVVRTDEGGALGTPFTISQLVGFLFLAIALLLWIFIERRPAGSALPLRQAVAS
jgi:phosphatidylglycerol:prolipoprotein diacylglycerol transferase